jgi:hypothetical protein
MLERPHESHDSCGLSMLNAREELTVMDRIKTEL